MRKDFIRFEEARKTYRVGDVDIRALDGVSFTLPEGALSLIAGSSGAGKSTALNILGGMDTLTSGGLFVDGREISALSERGLTSYRRSDIGFVFQFYNLMPNLTALENVELAVEICGDHFEPKALLERVGLGERLDNFPAQLSGGEQQRVAIARALAKKPKLLLCDEPTGALDYLTGKSILALLQQTCRETGMTVVIITHNLAVLPIGDKIVRLRSGLVESEELNLNPKPVETLEW